MDCIFDLTQWVGKKEPLAGVESKVKAALTRVYNKSSAPVPFAVDMKVKKKKKTANVEGEEDEEESGEEELVIFRENDDAH